MPLLVTPFRKKDERAYSTLLAQKGQPIAFMWFPKVFLRRNRLYTILLQHALSSMNTKEAAKLWEVTPITGKKSRKRFKKDASVSEASFEEYFCDHPLPQKRRLFRVHTRHVAAVDEGMR